MYTRCPSCQSLFRITTRQLKAARGKVRCGECQLPFDAIEFLVNRDELSKSEQKAAAKLERDNHTPQWQLPFDGKPAEQASETPAHELTETPADAESAAPSNTLTEETAVESAPVETQPAATHKTGFTEPPPQVEPPPTEERPYLTREGEDATAEERPLPSQEDVPATPAEPQKSAEEGDPIASPERFSLSAMLPHQPRYTLPEKELQPRRSRLARLGWTVASLLLMVALAAQLALLNRATLVDNYPATQPWLERLCQLARCEQPTRRDLKSIEMIERTVLTHPEYQKTLLITATLVNKAPFAQPYPVVELIMTNLEQKPVASRRFLPAEYLKDGNPDTVFTPGAAIRLRLEVVDPGEEAVGFEFAFH